MAGQGTESRELFQQGIELFSRRQYDEAEACLQKAAQAGEAEAQNLLGVMALNGMGPAQDPHRAVEFFSAAAGSGLKEGHYNLSNLLYNGLGVARDTVRAQEHLLIAARAGHRPALRNLGYLYHLAGPDERWQRLATQCFRSAAEAGDNLAKYSLGLRLALGQGTPADPAAAMHWLDAAAQAGVYLAGTRFKELRSHSQEPYRESRNPAPIEALIPFTPAEPVVPQAARSVAFLSEHPAALDPLLCDHFINLATPSLEPSGVVDPTTGQALRSQLRTSYSMSFVPSMYDSVVAEVLRRIAAIAGLPPENAEPVGVLRYGPGQEYRPHFDFYDDAYHEAQRVSTVFIYLNDVAEGGGTEFPRLGATVEPARGKAVKFLNCDASGKPNAETLHAGLPVIHGEKWLATFWFWDRPFLWFS